MTIEEAQALIKKGNETGNYRLVEEGLAAIKQIEKESYIAPIVRKPKQTDKSIAKKEAVNPNKINAFNMFHDDGKEHKDQKLNKKEKGAWSISPREAKINHVEVVCGNCSKKFLVHPPFAKSITSNDDGSEFNPNICDDCIRKKKRI